MRGFYLLVVAETYEEYRTWYHAHFPYIERNYSKLDPPIFYAGSGEEGYERCAGLVAGLPYVHLSGVVDEQFNRRFTRIQLI